MIRNKIYNNSRVLGKYNMVLDATRFQKAKYEVSREWLNETIENQKIWYLSMLELKLVANNMAISIRKITEKNVYKIIYCAKLRDYKENQGFKEQKVTSGIDLEHVYSKNIKAIEVIYTIIQITHLILQIIEHSDICGNFKEKYESVKVFRRKFYAHLTERQINIEIILTKIQIRFNKLILS